MKNSLNFDNITISGGVGVGNTTLLSNLLPNLTPLGFRYKSTGEFFREYTKENTHPVATLWKDEVDKKVDSEVQKLLETETKWIIEGWLTGFLAKDLKNTLRILMVCSDKREQYNRVSAREKISFEKAKVLVIERETQNFAKWRRLYGEHDFFDPIYYTCRIDTAIKSKEESLAIVLKKLGIEK